MIKVNVPIHPAFSTKRKAEDYTTYAANVLAALRAKGPQNIVSDDFKDHWNQFKYELWEKQNRKCCYCEQKMNEQDCHVEHYRPKGKIGLGRNKTPGYWWLAYEWKNFLVVCATCNRQKSSEFPLSDPLTRAEAETALNENGSLGEEVPLLINPRFENPEDFIEYDITQFKRTGEVYLKGKDSNTTDLQRGNYTKNLIDLNRERVNKKRDRDNLTGKRGKKYGELKDIFDEYNYHKKRVEKLKFEMLPLAPPEFVPEIEKQINAASSELTKQEERINNAMKDDSEFSGMCRWCYASYIA